MIAGRSASSVRWTNNVKANIDLSNKVSHYNQLQSDADKALIEVKEAELAVRDLSERSLAGVAQRFGKAATEYTQAGGTRTADRKRPVRTGKAKASKPGQTATLLASSPAATAEPANAIVVANASGQPLVVTTSAAAPIAPASNAKVNGASNGRSL